MRERGHGHDFSWYGGGHPHDDWWSGPLHLIFALLVVAALVTLVVWLVRHYGHHVVPQTPAPALATAGAPAVAAPQPAADPAISTLRLRYAQGEVSREEYLTRMTDLTGGSSGETAPTGTWPGEAPTDEATPPA